MRDRLVISIKNNTIYCGDADENKVGGCAIAVRNDYKNLVEEFGSTSSRCAFLRLWDRRGRKLWIVSAHAPTETAEDNSKDAFYDELNALMSKIPSQQVVIDEPTWNRRKYEDGTRTAIRCARKMGLCSGAHVGQR
ncbi:hypothetical protein RB195_015212 [Necator americanus]